MDTIGQRIRAWRRRRGGMSQKVLADLAGLSQGYVSQIENGQRALDRKSTQVAIAGALNISVAQLLGDPAATADPVRDRALAYVPAIRSGLVDLTHGERNKPTRDRDAVRAAVREITDLRNDADCAGVAARLPGLIADLAAYGDDLAPELVETLVCARFALKIMGQVDLSREATQLGVAAMRDHDDLTWRGYADFVAAQALPPENAALAARISARTATDLEHHSGDGARQVYGMLHLAAALSAAVASRADDADAHLAEATHVARIRGEPTRYGRLSAGFAGMWFGPANALFWRMAVAAELGNAGEALAVANRVDLSELPVPNRHVYHWIDLARALAGDGRHDREAMRALMAAERAAPQQVRANPIVRNLVETFIARAKRRAVGAEFARLARTMGIAPI